MPSHLRHVASPVHLTRSGFPVHATQCHSDPFRLAVGSQLSYVKRTSMPCFQYVSYKGYCLDKTGYLGRTFSSKHNPGGICRIWDI